MIMVGQLVNRGRSQFLVLPEGIRFPGKTVQLRRYGDGVLIIPEDHPDFHRTGRSRKNATSLKSEK